MLENLKIETVFSSSQHLTELGKDNPANMNYKNIFELLALMVFTSQETTNMVALTAKQSIVKLSFISCILCLD